MLRQSHKRGLTLVEVMIGIGLFFIIAWIFLIGMVPP